MLLSQPLHIIILWTHNPALNDGTLTAIVTHTKCLFFILLVHRVLDMFLKCLWSEIQ